MKTGPRHLERHSLRILVMIIEMNRRIVDFAYRPQAGNTFSQQRNWAMASGSVRHCTFSLRSKTGPGCVSVIAVEFVCD